MKFIPYPKIASLNEGLITDFKADEKTALNDWYVNEMVDGLHLCIYADAKHNFFKAGSRKRFLEDTDTYSIWKKTSLLQKAWALELSSVWKAPLIIYGKMLGGQYGGESSGTPIKTVCEYLVHNEYIIHDIKLPEGFISMKELEETAEKLALSTAPILYKGKFIPSCGYPENNLSILPFMNYLDVNYKNEMKGIIIRSDCDLYMGGQRMALKKLNKRYVGRNQTQSTKSVLTPVLSDIAYYMEAEANNRGMLDLCITDMGAFDEYDLPMLTGKYVRHLLEHTSYIKYNMLSKQQKNLVNREINKYANARLQKMIIGVAA